jgi:hypothetical protein
MSHKDSPIPHGPVHAEEGRCPHRAHADDGVQRQPPGAGAHWQRLHPSPRRPLPYTQGIVAPTPAAPRGDPRRSSATKIPSLLRCAPGPPPRAPARHGDGARALRPLRPARPRRPQHGCRLSVHSFKFGITELFALREAASRTPHPRRRPPPRHHGRLPRHPSTAATASSRSPRSTPRRTSASRPRTRGPTRPPSGCSSPTYTRASPSRPWTTLSASRADFSAAPRGGAEQPRARGGHRGAARAGGEGQPAQLASAQASCR